MKANSDKAVLIIDRFPFYIGAISEGSNPAIPAFLPFEIYVDDIWCIPRLVVTEQIKSALNDAYAHGSMLSTPLGSSKLSTARLNEFVQNLLDILGEDLTGKFLVEVGAGEGGLLHAIKCLGGQVLGFEIGPQANIGIAKYDLNIIQDEFNPKFFDPESIDCVYSAGCLEHMFDPVGFIDQAWSSLRNNGLFFHSVPNSKFIFEEFDVQGFAHEHVNYFTPENSVRLLEARGYVNCGFALSNAGNEMFIYGFKDSTACKTMPCCMDTNAYEREVNVLLTFDENISSTLSKLTHHLRELSKINSIGFYAGGHIFARLSSIENVRFFDGDSAKWGKRWLIGQRCIEDPRVLVNDPVDVLIVASNHYYDQIHSFLNTEVGIPSTIRVTSLKEICLMDLN